MRSSIEAGAGLPAKTLVMTGGTSGIGRRVVERMLAERAEWRVVLLARESPRSDELRTLAGAERLQTVAVDLASLVSVDRACDEVLRLLGAAKIDGLGLNAGMQAIGGDEVSEDGYELSFAVNHLAHFAIAERLIGRVRSGGRVVITASEVHDPDVFCLVGQRRAYWQDPAELADARRSQRDIEAGVERGEARYCASKLMNVMHARLLAREAPHIGVVSFNPGVVAGTEIARDRFLLMRLGWKYLMPLLEPILPGARSLETSAGDLIHLLTEADLGAISGSYVDGRMVAPGSADSRDGSKIARMVGVSRTLIAQAREARADVIGKPRARAARG